MARIESGVIEVSLEKLGIVDKNAKRELLFNHIVWLRFNVYVNSIGNIMLFQASLTLILLICGRPDAI
jgi:hypothetical protein